jgi:hypothetical protein
VNSPPIVTLTGPALTFKENGLPTRVSANLKLLDPDHIMLAGATVAITENFNAGQDVLAATTRAGIASSFDSGTGILTLTGMAKLTDYRAVLRSVTYKNTSDGPLTAPRTLSFAATDGTEASLLPAVRTVGVMPINDAPVLDTSGNPELPLVYSFETDPAGTTVADLLGLSATDPDAGALRGIAVTGLTGTTSGTWQYSLDGSTWLTISGMTATKGLLLRETDRIRFLPINGVTGTHTISYRAWDQATGAAGLMWFPWRPRSRR